MKHFVPHNGGRGKGNHENFTGHKRAEQALRLSAMVYQAIGEAIMVLTPERKIAAVNPAFTRLTGYTEAEAIGAPIDILVPQCDQRNLYREIRHTLAQTGHWQGKIWSRRKNGESCIDWLVIDTIFDTDGEVKHRIGMFSPVTDQKLAEQTIWRQANFDTLTGLPNRSMFRDRLEHEIKRATHSGLPLALLFIDLDRFKEINDTLGHDIGDILLKEAAARLQDSIRQVDTIARMGGDEFSIILSELADLNVVERVAREILQKCAAPYRLGGETAHISASIGITLYPRDAESIDALQKNADQAMYAAKSQGRNRFSYFTPAMQRSAQARMRMTNDLHRALNEQQFRLMYQPVVELASGSITKAEALIRWQHPQRGEIGPAEFIPVAEEAGLLPAIGEWVIREAACQAAHWRATVNPAFQISVNMSPLQFRKHGQGTAEWFAQLQRAAQPGSLLGGQIAVEITEGLLLESSACVTDQLLVFRDAGIEVAIDDFGTGYSSLSYLKKFHIDYLKIDQSFVLKMTANSDDLALCQAIIVMGHKLGIKIIAEGVETSEQRDLLATAGCDYGQGFLFSRPQPAAALSHLLKPAGTPAHV